MLEKLDTSPRVWIRKDGKEDWHEDTTEALKPFPYTADEISFLMIDDREDDKRKCWCPRHQNFEYATFTSTTNRNNQMESACAFSKYQFVMLGIDNEDLNTNHSIPIRIELSQTDDGHLLKLKVICVHVKFLKVLHWRKIGWDWKPHFSFSEVYYELDMENGTYHSFPDNSGYRWDVNWEGQNELFKKYCLHRPVDDTLPTKVFEVVKDRIWAYMAARIAPYKILWPKNLPIEKLGDLLRLIKHPMDIHISFLENFSQINEKLGNKRTSHSFKDLCKIFNCKPPYKVRKMYGDNPYTFIKYLWLMGLGFKDIEAIVYYMGYHSDWNGSHISYNFEKNEILWNENNYWPDKKDVDFYMKWQLKNGLNENSVINNLIKGRNREEYECYKDALYMFHHYEDKLSDNVKQNILMHGLNKEVHDMIAREVNKIEGQSIAEEIFLDYSRDIIDLNGDFNGYKFSVVQYLNLLPLIGKGMDNCVASYKDKVAKGESIIITAEKDFNYDICIELQPAKKTIYKNGIEMEQLLVVQAKGRKNARLKDGPLAACIEWINKRPVILSCDDIRILDN